MREEIRALIDQYPPRDPNALLAADSLPLAATSFGREKLKRQWKVFFRVDHDGKKVAAFEESWADYVGVPHAIAVNLGSSALLVMISAMVSCGYLQRGQEVLVPALGWSTSLFLWHKQVFILFWLMSMSIHSVLKEPGSDLFWPFIS